MPKVLHILLPQQACVDSTLFLILLSGACSHNSCSLYAGYHHSQNKLTYAMYANDFDSEEKCVACGNKLPIILIKESMAIWT